MKQVNIAICAQIGVPVETFGKFSVVAGRAGVLQFRVPAIAAKHSFSSAAACVGIVAPPIVRVGNSQTKTARRRSVLGETPLSWQQGNSSTRAAGGAALTISDVESGSLLSGLVFPLCLQPELGGFTV